MKSPLTSSVAFFAALTLSLITTRAQTPHSEKRWNPLSLINENKSPEMPQEAIIKQVVKDFDISAAELEKEPWSAILQQDNWYHRSQVMEWPVADRMATKTVAPSGGRGDFVCEGKNDDIEIQKAIDSLPAEGGKVVLLPGNYVLGNCVRPRNNTELEIHGLLQVADAVRSEVTADVKAGATTISVADARRFRPGQWVTVIDDDPKKNHKGGRKYGETATVQSIRDNTLTLSVPLGVRWAKSKLQVDGYEVAKKAFVTTSHSAILVLGNHRVYIHGGGKPGEIDGRKGSPAPTAPLSVDEDIEDWRANCGISIVRSSWVKVEKLQVHDANLHNIAVYRSEHCEVAGVEAAGCNDKNIGVNSVNKLRLINNNCHDSVMEDGICCHTPGGSCILIAGNRASGNPRYGIHLGIASPNALIIRNDSHSNRTNLDVRLADPSLPKGAHVQSQSASDAFRLREKGVLLIENSIGEASQIKPEPEGGK